MSAHCEHGKQSWVRCLSCEVALQECLIAQLRADLAKAESVWRIQVDALAAEQRAHAETRKALEKCEQALLDTVASERDARAELARRAP